LKLDLSWLKTGADYDHDSFYLENLQIKSPQATEDEIANIFPMGKYGQNAAGYIYEIAPQISQNIFNLYREVSHRSNDYQSAKEPISGHFCRELLTGGKNCYLDGYWVTNKYYHNDVIDVRDELRRELPPSNELSGKNLQVANEIEDTVSVSLHIRRGDFVDLSRNIGLDYYSRATEQIAQEMDDFVLYVFSDKISWAKDNFEAEYPTKFVSHNDINTAYEDMRLMSLCDHNIIANSSFSWWGAWLNENENKQVIAPSRWTESWDIQGTDVIPEKWAILPIKQIGN
jgi:hypothetical protein